MDDAHLGEYLEDKDTGAVPWPGRMERESGVMGTPQPPLDTKTGLGPHSVLG